MDQSRSDVSVEFYVRFKLSNRSRDTKGEYTKYTDCIIPRRETTFKDVGIIILKAEPNIYHLKSVGVNDRQQTDSM